MDYQKVSNQLATSMGQKLASLEYENAQYKALCEELQEEKTKLTAELEEVKGKKEKAGK